MTLTTPSLTIGTPDVSTVGLPVYANTTRVAFTPYDFRLTFTLLSFPHQRPSVLEPAPVALVLTPRAVTEVVIPPGEASQLTDLLSAELKQYVQRFGEPHRGFA